MDAFSWTSPPPDTLEMLALAYLSDSELTYSGANGEWVCVTAQDGHAVVSARASRAAIVAVCELVLAESQIRTFELAIDDVPGPFAHAPRAIHVDAFACAL